MVPTANPVKTRALSLETPVLVDVCVFLVMTATIAKTTSTTVLPTLAKMVAPAPTLSTLSPVSVPLGFPVLHAKSTLTSVMLNI